MPIVDHESEYPKIPEQPKVVVTDKPKYSGINVDTKFIDASDLLTHVEGSSWTVQYFSQVLSKDSPLAGQMITRDAIYQQYILIKDMELKVNTPITYVQDEATKSIKGTGAATVYPFIIPNMGDLIIADIGDGKAGIFRVTTSERKTIFKNTVHTIEYVLIETSANREHYTERLEDLNTKTIETIVYVRDFLQHGQNPLLHKEEYDILRELRMFYHSTLERYFKMFLSNEYKTLLIPGQMWPTYDHFLTKAMLSFFSTDDTPDVRNVRILNVDDDIVMQATTIWDVLKEKDVKLLKYCFRRAGIVTTKSFTRNPMLEGIYHTGIAYVVYPLDAQCSVDHGTFNVIKPVYERGLKDTPSQIRDLSDLIGDTEFEGLTLPEVELIHPILIDNFYIFSQAFYTKNREEMSLIELCVMDYLEHKAPNINNLLLLAKTCHAWNGLERFFYTAILLILLKHAVRSI